MSTKPLNASQPWSQLELHYLCIMFEMRCTVEDIADTLHRTEQAVRQKIAEVKRQRRAAGILVA